MATRAIDEAFGLASPPSVVKTSGHLILTIVMSVMKSANGTVSKDLWGLSRALDLLALRGFVIDGDESFECYRERITAARLYPIVRLRTSDAFNKPIIIPLGVEALKLGRAFNYLIILPAGLKVLEFSEKGRFNHSVVLPKSLRKLMLSKRFNKKITLPEELEYLKLGANFSQQILLPPALKLLDMMFTGRFNSPLNLPDHIQELYLSKVFNHPMLLPIPFMRCRWGTTLGIR